MGNSIHQRPSDAVLAQAEQIAKGIQRPKQTKEQTRLIAKGIAQGIAQYKQEQKVKARTLDKARKKERRKKEQIPAGTGSAASASQPELSEAQPSTTSSVHYLPWWLLGFSWLGFICLAILLFDAQ